MTEIPTPQELIELKEIEERVRAQKVRALYDEWIEMHVIKFITP